MRCAISLCRDLVDRHYFHSVIFSKYQEQYLREHGMQGLKLFSAESESSPKVKF